MTRFLPSLAIILPLTACGAVNQLPSDDATVDRVEKAIVAACVNSGWFKMATSAGAAAYPVATLPVAALNAGVDKVCADPARYAADVGTVAWVIKNLRRR